MDDQQRWGALERVFHQALELEAGERASFLQMACGDDVGLRSRIESLLRYDEASVNKEAPPDGSSGPRIGAYQIVSKLGSGGMGDVYLAFDSRLGRHVAIKVLLPRFAADPDRKLRFAREARAAAVLNHPNIVAVYDFKTDGKLDYLVMEYAPGKALDRLIPNRGLKLNEALSYAIQIADALAHAHTACIVHRDLKPANVVITEAGAAKVLDFGLAKGIGLDLSTQTTRGMIVGTIAYMSPEQASGANVDGRSDIFSFGSMLYEMTTGRRPFERDSTAATLAAIANDEPPSAETVADGVPRTLAGIIGRCMRKDPTERFGSAMELKSALIDVGEPVASIGVARWVQRAALAVAACAVLAILLLRLRHSDHMQLELPPTSIAMPLTAYPFNEYSPTFSPDGSQVAFVWEGLKGDNSDIYVKVVGEYEPVRLTKDPLRDDAPAWSPDGRWIAFLRHLTTQTSDEQQPDARSSLMLLPATGGPERNIADIYTPASSFPRISWDPSGKWLVVPDKSSPGDSQALYLVSATDGEKRRLTTVPNGSVGDDDPSFSPDGRSIAFVRYEGEVSWLAVLQLDLNLKPIGEPGRLTVDGRLVMGPAWAMDNRSIVYASGSSHNPRLWRTWLPRPSAQPWPSEPLPFTGVTPAISSRGRLAFTAFQLDTDIQRLELVGAPTEPKAPNPPVTVIASTRLDHNPQYSPDGKRIAFASDRSGTHEIWVCERDGSNALQLTSFGGPYTADPVWSPDGNRIAFGSRSNGRPSIYLVNARGGGLRRLTGGDFQAGIAGWSRDGQWVYISSGAADRSRIWKISPDGGAALQVTKGPGNSRAVESSDRRFLYYLRDHGQVASLWRMPLPTGDPERLLDSVFGFNFALTDTGIFFIATQSHASIQFLRLADRKILTVARFGSAMPVYGMSVDRNGRSLLFPVIVDHTVDLMMVDNFR